MANMTRVRVRRDRPTPVALAVALCVTMLVVYVLTLNVSGPDVVQSMAPAPRVTREIEFEALEAWCVCMAACDTPEQARLMASAWVGRGAAGCSMEMDGAWRVVGAIYVERKEAERVAARLKQQEGIPAEALALRARSVGLRITAPQAQIEAIVAADGLLRNQANRLGELALQLDRGELRPDAARTLCAVASSEALATASALRAIPGAPDNALCAGLIELTQRLSGMLEDISNSEVAAASLSGMLRCAQVESFLGQWRMQQEIGG